MALQQWAVPQITQFLSIDEDSSRQIVSYSEHLSDEEAAQHLRNLLGDSPEALQFITSFNTMKAIPGTTSAPAATSNGTSHAASNATSNGHSEKGQSLQSSALGGPTTAPASTPVPRAAPNYPPDILAAMNTGNLLNPPSAQTYAPPPGPPPSSRSRGAPPAAAAGFAPPPGAPPSQQVQAALRRPPHTNAVIEAGLLRAKDEQEMQNLLQTVQMKFGIYNSDIEPEHDTDYYCNCMIHNYQRRKWARIPVQEKWSKAVMYPGEKSYNDDYRMTVLFTSNPYRYGVVSPYGNMGGGQWYQQSPQPRYHAISVQQTIQLNAKLNKEAQRNIDAREPTNSIWEIEEYPQENFMGDKKQAPTEKGRPVEKQSNSQYPDEKGAPPQYPDEKSSSQYPDEKKRMSFFGSSKSGATDTAPKADKPKKLNGLFRAMGVASAEQKAAAKSGKAARKAEDLKSLILAEEEGRWPDEAWRSIVTLYQEKIGMAKKVADLRARQPIQYLHLLRAGYFEPIPVAWANLASNPLKFSIEASSGWRGITPAWRGFEDTAEERLYWVLNHREGVAGIRMKPDFISEMNMARARMDKAVEPPPEYFAADDTCHTQHTSEGYSRQVMPPPFRPFDRPEKPTDDTMILLDVSGSMDFDPVRPVYDQYMITSYVRSTQPKNKDLAKAVVRRFSDAIQHHDHNSKGYDLVTFSSSASYIGSVNHKNLDQMWSRIKIGGGTRVMTGWQKVKDLHFQKHSESAIHHPVYGWQAGPDTPMLRLLLLLDGEATDMDEFELDLLGLSWAHVTIFLIGVDGCPHHHRHANELQRISDVNHHVSFVDSQGNCPERFVTHELLKRHLGYDVSMSEFRQMEELPAYS